MLPPPPLRLLPGGAIQFPGESLFSLWTSAFSRRTAIFRLTPSPVGQWKKTVLYDFEKFPDVSSPEAVAFDHHGNLYGNAAGGDINGGGSIFKLTPVSHGRWKLSVVHRFSTTAAVGFSPSAPVMDGKGNFYGTTLVGGTFGYGGCSI